MSNGKGQTGASRVLVIGIDGGTWDLFKPLIDEDKMPHLGKLLNNGAHGILMSTIPPVTAPAWSSFLTGKNPARHGVFDFIDWDGKLRKEKLVSSQSIHGQWFPEILSKQGKTVGLINVPLTYPNFIIFQVK